MKLLLKIKFHLFAGLFLCFSLQGQELYLATGLNVTTYDYKSTDNLPLNLMSNTGPFYELGYKIKMMDDRLNYGIGFAINNFDANGGDTANSYEWQATYMGLNNQLEYVFIPSSRSPIELSGGVQMQLMQIVNGTQKVNGGSYDLTNEKEFNGVWVQPGALFNVKYFVSDDWKLSLGYNYSIGYNMSNNTEEKLKFNNHQIRFGIHLLVN